MSDHDLDAKLNQQEHVLLKKKDKNISKRTTEIKKISTGKKEIERYQQGQEKEKRYCEEFFNSGASQ